MTTVESKGKFVEIGVQMRGCDRSLMRAEQPAFEPRSNAMHPWHGNVCRIAAAGNVGHPVPVSLSEKAVITFPAVGGNFRAGLSRYADKRGTKLALETSSTRCIRTRPNPFGDNTSMAITTINLVLAPRPRSMSRSQLKVVSGGQVDVTTRPSCWRSQWG